MTKTVDEALVEVIREKLGPKANLDQVSELLEKDTYRLLWWIINNRGIEQGALFAAAGHAKDLGEDEAIAKLCGTLDDVHAHYQLLIFLIEQIQQRYRNTTATARSA